MNLKYILSIIGCIWIFSRCHALPESEQARGVEICLSNAEITYQESLLIVSKLKLPAEIKTELINQAKSNLKSSCL